MREDAQRVAGVVTLADFPIDDVTLGLLDHALGACLTWEGVADRDDGPRVVGADMSVSRLLDFLSGYDGSKLTPLVDEDGYEVPDHFDYPDPLWHEHDVIRALIAEVRRLRAGAA